MDLLLELIEGREISINEISLASITEDYLTYIKSLDIPSETSIAEFLDVASTLILIKSRSLIPSINISEEEKSSINDLKRKLSVYGFFKKIALAIERGFGEKTLFCREAFLNVNPEFIEPRNLNIDVMVKVIEEIISFLPKEERLPQRIMPVMISIDKKIREIQSRFQSLLQTSLSALTVSANKLETIVSFLAILELIKQGFLKADQEAHFGEIKIIKA